SPALVTNTLSANGTCATPCGSLKPVILLSTLPAARSTTPKLLLPSSATNSRCRFRSIPRVIDTAAHLAKRYLRLEYQRWARRLRIRRGGPDDARGQKDRPPQHAQLLTILICASAAFSPSASFLASSLAQKCMK